MAIDFSKINLEIVDINTNVTPDIYISQSRITFSKRVLEYLDYPQYVQYCVDPSQKIFAIRLCERNETNIAPFSKIKSDQRGALSSTNQNLRDAMVAMIPDYEIKKRYKVTGEYDSENRVMYFDMATAKKANPRKKTGE